jgi:hypothetical protein
MRKWEYISSVVMPEDMEEELNLQGQKGWEFASLVVLQKMLPPSRMIGGNPMPQMLTEFKLLFKREISNPDMN